MDRYNSIDDGCLCAGNNNRRMEAFRRVISVLGEGKKGDYIPYRDSRLTQLLRGMSLYLSSFCPTESLILRDQTNSREKCMILQ